MTDSYVTPSLARRLASLLYELLLVGALLLTVSAVLTAVQAGLGKSAWLDILFQLVLVATLFGYFGYSWVKNGQTVAMKAWRLKLVDQHGALIGWRQAAVRYGVALALFIGLPVVSYLSWARSYGHQPVTLWLSALWCLMPFAAAYLDKDGLFLHDRLAGTRQILLPKRSRAAR